MELTFPTIYTLFISFHYEFSEMKLIRTKKCERLHLIIPISSIFFLHTFIVNLLDNDKVDFQENE